MSEKCLQAAGNGTSSLGKSVRGSENQLVVYFGDRVGRLCETFQTMEQPRNGIEVGVRYTFAKHLRRERYFKSMRPSLGACLETVGSRTSF